MIRVWRTVAKLRHGWTALNPVARDSGDGAVGGKCGPQIQGWFSNHRATARPDERRTPGPRQLAEPIGYRSDRHPK
jgi:hypothetical protein